MLEDRFAIIDVVPRWEKDAPLIRDAAFAVPADKEREALLDTFFFDEPS